MSEPENFLTRWSRRKQQAELKPDEPDVALDPQAAPAEPGAVAATDEPQEIVDGEPGDKEKEPEVDLSTLPSLDTIGADTDVRGFLQKGVPLNLTRAALSRAWTADPAIRNFIGIAENQWDFASGDIPGFGPLTASDDIVRMVSQITTEGFPRTLPKAESAPEPHPARDGEQEEKPAGEQQTTESETQSDPVNEPGAVDIAPTEEERPPAPPPEEALVEFRPTIVHREVEFVASQHVDADPSQSEAPPRRLHGRALPQ
ncbi:MAG: DUF3306 domain-containing protein [Pseudolabrys sp.]|nr:DUF3306 domain-containing protein [Pseudolabrys sp.]